MVIGSFVGHGGAVHRAISWRAGHDQLSEHRRQCYRDHYVCFEKNVFGLYWGSLDTHNTIKFYDGTTLALPTPAAIFCRCSRRVTRVRLPSNGYVEFSGLHSFNKVVLGSSSNAFEIDNISAGYIPPPGLSGPIKGTLSVHDADVGDALTALVTGNATIEYNGSSSVPGTSTYRRW